ncbi:hypothetical protein [uncultured Mucilaginibacter sp.]|uniref:hypothetical protein n=1 Tax=uncultured Mucilaginibacter sp. TaxID=797541 RepID=UPI002628321B|nr:hypothetical protein [uncultured Mucilaginibacter sp.]
MIRVYKSEVVPPSLQVENCKKYDNQDVQDSLVKDQHQKCYLCEQNTNKSYQIEHLRAKAENFNPELKFVWTNLLLSCSYCNGRKPNSFKLLDPVTNNVEDIITHRLDFSNNMVVFETSRNGIQENNTTKLLSKLFNGEVNLRDKKTQILFEDLQREIIFFLGLLNTYNLKKDHENKLKVIDSLNIKKEFLAFKYWIIKNNKTFYNDFKEYIIWNKHF